MQFKHPITSKLLATSVQGLSDIMLCLSSFYLSPLVIFVMYLLSYLGMETRNPSTLRVPTETAKTSKIKVVM